MLFNSGRFVLVFLPITLTIFFIFGKLGWRRVAIAWLVAASMFFYGWFSTRYLAMLAVLILVNFGLGQRLSRDFRDGKQRPYLLACGIAINLAVLAYFKYANFFIGNVNAAIGTTFVLQNIILPIGISFFTFQKIAYLVDAYRGEAEGYGLLEFSLFVMFFPQLIAGPIVHHKEIIPQFRRSDLRLSYADLAAGISLFVIGMVKKVLIADTVSEWANAAFSVAKAGGRLSFFDAWSGALSFALQIYFDFSGYTDMALGLALMVGIRLPQNFNSPYKAHNIIEFWRRWHMTLSRFLRDYVYIPLGGNRHGRARRYLNLMLTMLLGGFWHGAAWTFVVWGGLHGGYLAINHAWQSGREWLGWRSGFGLIGKLGSGLLTFLCVVIAWVFFRAEGFASAAAMLKAMAWSGDLGTMHIEWVAIAILLAFVWLLPSSQEVLGEWRPVIDVIHPAELPAILRRVAWRLGFVSSEGTFALTRSTGAIAGTLIFGLLVYQILHAATLQPFIYFQF
jgi:D-alanyl-lipoteichoic acid acyltransferase DltB (MBOAT superfamily)